jgi:Carboxypeptidase regulatory-like domain
MQATCRRLFAIAMMLLAFSPRAAWPQAATALLNGTIFDPAGAVVPNAQIILTHVDTSTAMETASGAEGLYSFPQLQVGDYELRVSAPGFRDYVQTGISLNLGDKVRVDVKLELGTAQQVVEVHADASLLNFENAEQKAGVAPKTLGELPLIVAGGVRSSATFLTLLPGAVSQTGDVLDARVNGAQQYSGEMILNGSSLVNPSGGQGLWGSFDFAQSPDMVSELQVLEANYEPQYGSAAGAVVIMETKSGTNEFHGGLFEFHRNTALNARQWGRDEVARDLENDFGFAIGGPLKLPGTWSNSHKTFFFFNYEGFRQRGGSTRDTLSIASLAERKGDFSDWVDGDGNLIPVFDPATTAVVDGAIVRTPFEGNVIPQSRIANSLANAWLGYLPQPTSSGPQNNFIATGVGSLWKANLNIFNAKVDEYIGEKDHVTLSLWAQDWPTYTESRLPDEISNDNDTYKHTWVNRLTWDHIFSPNLLNHLALGYNHDYYEAGPHNREFASVLPQIKGAPNHEQPANIDFTDGFSPLGTYNGFQKWPAPAIVGQDLVTLVAGKHTFKFGFEYRNQRNSYTSGQNQSGYLYFDGASTSLHDINSGSPIASFLLEQVNYGELSYVPFGLTSARWSSWIAHAGDTWKVTPKLSLSLGIRWDMHQPTAEQHDVFSFFDPQGANPGAGNRPGRLVFAGNRWGDASYGKRYPEELFKKGFAPRFGLAYAVSDKTVARLGYGIFYDAGYYPGWGGGMANDGFNLNSYAYGATNEGLGPAFVMSDGFPEDWRQYDLPVLDSSFLNGQSGPIYRPFDANRLPYSQQWNLSVEHEFGQDFSISASYVGTKGTRLTSRVAPLNVLNPSLLATYGDHLYDEFQPGDTELDGVPVPYDGWVEQMTACSASVAQALLPYPQYCGRLQGNNENAGNSTYHSLQLKLDKQFSNGLWALVSYTASKMLTDTENNQPDGYGISPFERHRNKALSLGDVPQVFVASVVYDLPFGQGKHWLNRGGALNYLIGGWRVSSVTRLSSGAPFRITSSQCNVPDQFGVQCLPGVLPGANAFAASTSNFDPNAGPLLNASAFESPNSFNSYYGVGPRVTNLRGFGYKNQDLTVAKHFRITERITFQLRADVFNLFNLHTLRGYNNGFDTDVASPSFGTWNGDVSGPRTVQIGGRIDF